MSLYYISIFDPNGESLELIVNATTPQRAVDFWASYYGLEAPTAVESDFDGVQKARENAHMTEAVGSIFKLTWSEASEGPLDWNFRESANNASIVAYFIAEEDDD